MKKIIPILTLIGTSALIVGCDSTMNTKSQNFTDNFQSFQNNLEKYTNFNNENLNKIALNKYKLSLSIPENATLVNGELQTDENEEIIDEQSDNNTSQNELQFNEINPDNITDNDDKNNKTQTNLNQISTLYSLSSDLETQCDEFCSLKEQLTNAIIETDNLIEKIQNKELDLTREQRMFITEQSMQLKNLGRQLSNATTELTFNLSDLNEIMTSNNNIDNLSLKYLIVLDNLVNGNEMMQSGLSTLNLINQMFKTENSFIPPNNQGRILYGFKHNDNPPTIKDYYIDENGELIENKTKDENIEEVSNEKKGNIDTYKNTALNSNIDTYGNNFQNIDTFFNTALLDNEFMYGAGPRGYGQFGGYYGANPYLSQYSQYENFNKNNSMYGNNQYYSTQNIEQKNNQEIKNNKKGFNLKKNIDTYRDENTLTPSAKIGNLKNSISGFFSKFKRPKDRAENPVYRETEKDAIN